MVSHQCYDMVLIHHLHLYGYTLRIGSDVTCTELSALRIYIEHTDVGVRVPGASRGPVDPALLIRTKIDLECPLNVSSSPISASR